MFELDGPYFINEGKTIRTFPSTYWGVDISNKEFNFQTKYMVLEVRLVEKDNKSNYLKLLEYPVTADGITDPDNPEQSTETFDQIWADYIDLSSGGPVFNLEGVEWLIAKVPNLKLKLS